MELSTLSRILKKNLLVTIKDGRQVTGVLCGHLNEENDYSKVTQISILPAQGVPVQIKTQDIADIRELD